MAFSRLQLAAALIEYDNDNPQAVYGPKRASESVLFSNTRQRVPSASQARYQPSAQEDDRQTQWVTAPSQYSQEPGSGRSIRNDVDGQSQGRMSYRAGPPLGQADADEEVEEDEEPIGEVDLASWGLPEEFVAQQRQRRPRQPEAKRSMSPARRVVERSSVMDRPRSEYASSLLNIDVSMSEQHGRQAGVQPISPSVERAIEAMPSTSRPGGVGRAGRHGGRTVSFGDYDSMVQASQAQIRREEHGEAEVLADVEGEEDRPAPRPNSSMGIMNRGRPTSPYSDIARDSSEHQRRTSFSSDTTSRPGSVPFPTEHGRSPSAMSAMQPPHSPASGSDVGTPNPFALPAPAGQRLSRFDPKAAAEARPLPRPNSRVSGYFAGAEPADEVDHRRRSTMTPPDLSNSRLLRPRTLVMPTPLQAAMDPSVSSPPPRLTRGFQQGAKPLPPGALTRPDSFIGSMPSMQHLTTSQKLFSASLEVDGRRDEEFIGGAEADGEIRYSAIGGYEDEEGHRYGEEEWRPPRTVEGMSLMDKLEARKMELKSKKRQFQGDARPSMMARDSWRSDGQGYEQAMGPTSPSSQSRQLNRQSMAGQPLLVFDSADPVASLATSPPVPNNARMTRGRSVFGSDKVWERELEKLKLAEEAERAEAEARQAEKEQRERNKAKKARKGKGREMDLDQEAPAEPFSTQDVPEQSDLRSPIEEAPARRSSADLLRDANRPVMGVEDWAASSDEEGKPAKRTIKPVSARRDSSGSDSDVPLSRIRARQSVMPMVAGEDDSSSEDEEPLSRLVQNRSTLTAVPRGKPAAENDATEDEDDIPLALRRLTLNPQTSTRPESEDEDDIPLGLKHTAAAMSQQQMQQGQLSQEQTMAMFAAQQQFEQLQRQSMFGMGMMGMGMGGMPNMPFPGMQQPGMMGMPMQGRPYMDPAAFGASMASLHGVPQAQDPGIDRWRRQVEPKEGSVFSERTSLSRLSGLRSEVGV